MGNNSEEWLGQRFDRLTVVDFTRAEPPNRGWWWVCRCDCGTNKRFRPTDVKRGKVRSCGCLLKEVSTEKARKFDHSVLDHKRLYSIYNWIKRRCYRMVEPRYKDYGGRGIRMADEWLDPSGGFDRFVEWSLENGYTDEMTIDRIDVNGNYEPANCRWLPLSEQALNKRETLWVEYNGERVPLMTLCNRLGVSYDTVHNRIYSLGWSAESAVDTPSLQQDSLMSKCRDRGINYMTVLSRIRKFGWSEEDALNTPSRGRGTKGRDNK